LDEKTKPSLSTKKLKFVYGTFLYPYCRERNPLLVIKMLLTHASVFGSKDLYEIYYVK